jgi:hypothetical protein
MSSTLVARQRSTFIACDFADLWERPRNVDQIKRHGAKLFFWCAKDGQGFRVYDVALVDGRVRIVPYESKRATHRVFVAVVGHQWRYAFNENDLRTIVARELAQQRAAAIFHPGKNQHGADPRGGPRRA